MWTKGRDTGLGESSKMRTSGWGEVKNQNKPGLSVLLVLVKLGL